MERIQNARTNGPRWRWKPAQNLSDLPTNPPTNLGSKEQDKEPSSEGQELNGSSGEPGSRSPKEPILQEPLIGDPITPDLQVTP